MDTDDGNFTTDELIKYNHSIYCGTLPIYLFYSKIVS